MDLLRFCRICLKSSGYHSNMFTEIISNKHLYQLINNICELRVFHNDGLPEHICVDCFQSIKRICSFKTRAKETDTALTRMKKNRNMISIKQAEEVKDDEESVRSPFDHGTVGVNEIFIKEEPIDLTGNSHEDQRLSEDDAELTESQDYDRFGSNLQENMQDVDSEVIDGITRPESNLRSFPESICRVEMILPDEGEENDMKFKEDLGGNTPTQSFDEEVSLRSSVSIKDEIEIEEMIIPGEQIHRTNAPDTEIQCHYCGEMRETKEELGQHIQDAHSDTITEYVPSEKGKGRHVCPVCGRAYVREHNLIGHMRVHTDDKPFKCTECSYSCSKSSQFKRHMFTHTGEKPFHCTMCDYKAAERTQLKIHMLSHTGEKPMKCSLCSYQCSAKGTLNRHMLVHTGEKPIQCPVCEYKCARNGQLKTHMLTHTREKPFECNTCDYRCTQKGTLKIHMLTHSEEKPIKCPECSYRCSEKRNLRTHMLSHTGEKPFQCSYCDYRCTRKDNLNKHMLGHTGDKPFQCNSCDRKFSHKKHLKQHMLTHTGQKPFQCTFCEFKSARNDNLKAHMKIHQK